MSDTLTMVLYVGACFLVVLAAYLLGRRDGIRESQRIEAQYRIEPQERQ